MKVVTDDMTPKEKSLAEWVERLIKIIEDKKVLRDEFALAALPSLIHINNTMNGYCQREGFDRVFTANCAYKYADAMLNAREVKND